LLSPALRKGTSFIGVGADLSLPQVFLVTISMCVGVCVKAILGAERQGGYFHNGLFAFKEIANDNGL
jgi:hypothetical protein